MRGSSRKRSSGGRSRAIRRVARSTCALVLLAGCYRYVPFEGAPPPAAPGSEVRLYLTPEGTSALDSALAPRTTILTGRVDAAQDGGLVLLVSSTTNAYGATTRWVDQRVTIPPGAIARGERRVLDRRRTALVGGGAALAATVGFVAMKLGGGGQRGDGITPEPP